MLISVWEQAARCVQDNATSIAAILLASSKFGPNIKKISSHLQIPRPYVSQVSKNARALGIWKGNKVSNNYYAIDDENVMLLKLCFDILAIQKYRI